MGFDHIREPFEALFSTLLDLATVNPVGLIILMNRSRALLSSWMAIPLA